MKDIIKTIEHQGISINIHLDTDPRNPYEEWDGNMPLMYSSGRRSEVTDYTKGDISEFLKNFPSDNQIIRHQSYLAELFEDIDLEYMTEWTKSEKAGEIRYYIGNCTDFDVLESYCNLFKIPCLNTCSRGYSQGDYADLFFCYTDKSATETGLKKKDYINQFEGAKKLWAAWAWGDVYGYNIPEIGESCWGYYGDDHKESGLIEGAEDQINWYIENKRKTKQSKLKTLVKNHVPLDKREQILNSI